MILESKAKRRLSNKFRNDIAESPNISLFDISAANTELLNIVKASGDLLTPEIVFIACFLSASHFAFITDRVIVLAAGDETTEIQFDAIKYAGIDIGTELRMGRKKIDVSKITVKTSSQVFYIEFANQEGMFLFDKIIRNIFISGTHL